MSTLLEIRLLRRDVYAPGDYITVCGTTYRVVRANRKHVHARPLRWYERAWLWLTARLKP